MQKITLISLSTPTKCNVRAASALPYMLISNAPDDIKFTVYSFNFNNIQSEDIKNIESQLGVSIHILKRPWWEKWLFKLHLLFLRVFMRYPLLAYYSLSAEDKEHINNEHSDVIWIYGEELAGLTKSFPGRKHIVTMPDCEAMYYYRLLKMNFSTGSLSKILRYSIAYYKYRCMEHDNCSSDTLFHFVGKEDADFYNTINPQAKGFFLSHPVSRPLQIKKDFHFHDRIRLVIAGRYDIYQRQATDELVSAMLAAGKGLSESFCITFLGKNWHEAAQRLIASGWNVEIKEWVDDYSAELQRHDIEIAPVSVGTGTKGKVLDAFANGLLVIGTPYALENISAKNGETACCYKKAEEAVEILKDIMKNTTYYEDMAERGQKTVLSLHDAGMISAKLFHKICKSVMQEA